VSRRSRQNKNPNSTDDLIIRTHHSAAAGDVASNLALDMRLKTISTAGVQRPPSNYRSMIYWAESSYEVNLSLPASGILGQNNLTFSANASPKLTNLTAQFDQYLIYAAVVRWFMDSTLNTAPAVSYGRICTAIDFDNANTLTSFGAFEDDSTAQVDTLIVGKSWERFLKPCVTPAIYNGSSSFSGFGVGRYWIDSASNAVPHFGLRTGVVGNPSTTQAYNLVGVVTLIMGFRNSV
jgi:hypothetical protein